MRFADKEIYIIAGVTASGKSSLAIEFAKQIHGVIVNADSRQIYKELKIGSAQPIPERKESAHWIVDGIKHYLYGYVSITTPYTVVEFQIDVYKLIEKLNEPIILVGGSGLFVDAVTYDYRFPKTEEQTEELSSLSIESLQALIPNEILNSMTESDVKNRHRLIQTINRGESGEKGDPIFRKYFVISPKKEDLVKNIAQRTEQMVKNGLVEEVTKLWNIYPGFTIPALNTIGYKEFIPYFTNSATIPEVTAMINLHTLQYTKRQRTWFRRNPEAIWIEEPTLEALGAYTI